MIRYTIIDSHVHVGTGRIPLGPIEIDDSFRLWVNRASEYGIQRAVLMAAPGGTYDMSNDKVARIACRDPAKWLWYVFVNPVRDGHRINDIVSEAHARGACGIKVHWSDGMATDAVAGAARRHGMPVLFDPGGQVDVVNFLASRHPDVAWIVPHLSSFSDNWLRQKQLIDVASMQPNVFTDTSGVRYFDLLVEAVRKAGAHKIIFGSDSPFLHPGAELEKVRALHLSFDEQDFIFRKNILRLVRPAILARVTNNA